MQETASFIGFILLTFAVSVVGVLAPFPVLYFALKKGRRAGAAIAVAVTLLLSAVNPACALFYLLQCGLFPLLLAEFVSRGKGAARAVIYAAAINVLIIAAAAVVYGFWQGTDIDALILKEINDFALNAEAQLRANPPKEDVSEYVLQLRQMADFVAKTYPALFFIGLSAIGGLNLLLLKKFAGTIPRQLGFRDFSGYKNPEKLVWVLIVSGFALLLNNDMVTRVALNVLLLALSLYFVQGMSVAVHFFRRFQIPGFIRLLFYVMSVAQLYLTIAVAAVGLFDLWCDFRTPKKQENL